MNKEFTPVQIDSMLSCKDISIALRIALDKGDRFWKNSAAQQLRLQIIHNKLLLHMAQTPRIVSRSLKITIN